MDELWKDCVVAVRLHMKASDSPNMNDLVFVATEPEMECQA